MKEQNKLQFNVSALPYKILIESLTLPLSNLRTSYQIANGIESIKQNHKLLYTGFFINNISKTFLLPLNFTVKSYLEERLEIPSPYSSVVSGAMLAPLINASEFCRMLEYQRIFTKDERALTTLLSKVVEKKGIIPCMTIGMPFGMWRSAVGATTFFTCIPKFNEYYKDEPFKLCTSIAIASVISTIITQPQDFYQTCLQENFINSSLEPHNTCANSSSFYKEFVQNPKKFFGGFTPRALKGITASLFGIIIFSNSEENDKNI